ncbi:MAG: hypothetical protein EBR02_09215 [Alphaproteobacteria bacterium]|nr:hypothetical protein [Alphaproteobacteria bacterium]
MAFGIVLGSIKGAVALLGKEKFAKFEEDFAKKVVCKPLKLPTHLPNGVETKAFRYGRLTAMDIFATAASASILYIASRFFAEPDKDFPCAPKDELGNSLKGKPQPLLFAPEMTEPIAGAADKNTSALVQKPRSILSRATSISSAGFAETTAVRKQSDSGMALAE